MRPSAGLWALVAAALALRLFDLAGESLWLDEGVAIRIASLSLQETVAITVEDVHPPLFRSLLHVWIGLFGRGEFAARLLSALLGTFSVLLLGRIGFRLGGPFLGLTAAALLAVSPMAIRYSQDATSYALYLFLALTSYLFFLRWLASRRRLDGFAYALATAALLYAHNAAWFVVGAQWLTVLWSLAGAPIPRGELLLRWIFLQAGVLALYAPWIPILFRQVRHVQTDFWIPPPLARTIGGTALDYAGSPWMVVVLGAAAAAGLLWPRPTAEEPERPWPSRLALFVPWLVVPIAGPFVASYTFTPIYLTRVTIAVLAALYLLAARGVALARASWLRATFATLLLVGTALPLVSHYREPNKERWREAARDLESWAAPGDLVLVHAGFCKEGVLDYYLKRRDLDVVPFPADHWAVSDADIAELRRRIAGRRRIWLVRAHGGDGSGAIVTTLTQALPRMTERDYPQAHFRWSPSPPYIGVALLRFEADSAAAQAPGAHGR